MRRHWQYFKYVIRHKWFVFLACIPLGVPILSAVFHDWDKFTPEEWFPYARCFYAANGAKQYNESTAFTYAWNAHQKRNKHHYQYWLITFDRGNTECLAMPDVHRREMLADWHGAGRALGFPDTLSWYSKNRDNIKLNDQTRDWVEKQLGYKVN